MSADTLTVDWTGFIPADPQDIDRLPPADLDVCTTCDGTRAVQIDQRDPASVEDCWTCDGTGSIGGAA